MQVSCCLLPARYCPLFLSRPHRSNHAGTFTYDRIEEPREILTAQHQSKRVFVAARTTYLHLPAYPRATELSHDEWKNVLTAPVKSLRDRNPRLAGR